MLVVGTVSTALLTFMLGRLPAVTHPSWVVHVTRPGAYRIAAPYALPRGTPCPS